MSSKTNAIRLLETAGITFDIINYTYDSDDLSVEKIADDNGLPLAQVFKTLVAKGDKTGVVVAVIAGDSTLNLKALAKVSGNRKMALLPLKELQKETGYIRGGCSPVGMKKSFPVFLDRHAEDFSKIYVNAGARGILMGLDPQALLHVTGGVLFGER